ncbi:sugar phosphate isomerase/epimerase [Phenylobacterium sp.]|uniref:sugar phosphate isomerase/epimerase family protein n=1 Tax=Phenylobacterium sp. TaxID=1871053 RepID=UPI002DF3E5FE|nr:sugar phosphate isomerase/epimerase [Phenylobacterium sp.]
MPIGLQLYSVAAELRADLEATLKAVAGIGFKTVETAGYGGHAVKALRAAFDAHGLTCASAHVQPRGNGPEPNLSGDLGRLAADMHVLGARHVVMPSFLVPEGKTLRSPLTLDDWRATAAFLNRVGAGLKREGLQFAYHNHNPEFAPLERGTAYDLLLNETDPALVQFEMDAGWVVAGGVDPVALVKAHPGRFKMMHVKDVAAGVEPNFAFRVTTTAVGAGVIDWKRLLPAAYAAGVHEFFVEHEPPFTRPVLETLQQSFANLSAMAG